MTKNTEKKTEKKKKSYAEMTREERVTGQVPLEERKGE